jgi:alpha-L-rhamnosidase
MEKVPKAEGPSGVLTLQLLPPVRITKELQPVSIKEVGKDTFIVDMGQNFAGVARIRVQGPAGKQVVLRYGEDIHPNGRLNFLTTTAGHIKEMWNLKGGPGAPKTAWQEDRYTLKGSGTEVWAPRFTFHGFRYVEITGWPGTPTVADITGLRMNSDVQTNGTFACSNEMFNKLNEAIKWTFLSNVFSVQSDCPGREKMGYGADIVVTSEAFLYNFDMANFYRKTVQDFANEQQPDGGITEIAPYTGIADRGYGGESGPLGWQLAFPYLQQKLYEFYGDTAIIASQYGNVVKQMDFLQSKAVDHLFYWDISDHEALDTKPEAFTAASFYYQHAVLAADFAGILGKREDSLKYADLSGKIKEAILRKYAVTGTGRFDNATQAAQIFALWYGFAPDRQQALKVLMEEYARHNWHLSTGIFSTKMMFDVLRNENNNETAYRIANQRDYPGWGHMLASDATTLWESWKKPDNATTLNHPMFGSISEWFYRSLLGINALVPGFEKIQIKPQPAGDLTWAKGSYQSIRGTIQSDWKRDKNDFELRVSIPANATAEVWIPAKENSSITEGGKKLADTNGAKLLRYQDGYAVLETGSGTYDFKTNLR